MKLKSSGEMCTVKYAYSSGKVEVTKPDGSTKDDVKPSEFEWESQMPAFCAGLAASSSLLSVSDSMQCKGVCRGPVVALIFDNKSLPN